MSAVRTCSLPRYGTYPVENTGFSFRPKRAAPILLFMFHVFEGSDRSQELATCFGIEAWNFNQHRLNGAEADIVRLTEMFSGEEVTTFEVLRDAGFGFYFIPNG